MRRFLVIASAILLLCGTASAASTNSNVTGTGNVFNPGRLCTPPTGGTAGQVLAKNSSANCDLLWQTATGGGGGGTVSSGTIHQLGYYPATGTTISGDANFLENGINVNLFSTTGGYQIGTLNALKLTSTGNPILGDTAFNGALAPLSIAIGKNALAATTTATWSVAVGHNALSANTSGIQSNAIGYAALAATTTGSDNNALGWSALTANTTGSKNVAIGTSALATATGSTGMVAIGYQALKLSASTGTGNTAIGYLAGSSVTTGYGNVGVGYGAYVGDTSQYNVVIGASSGVNSGNGGANIIVGANNSAYGFADEIMIGTGSIVYASNGIGIGDGSSVGSSAVLIAHGSGVAYAASDNSVIIGYNAAKNVTGAGNTVLGYQVGSTTLGSGTGNILIGTSSAVTTPAAGTTNYLNIGKLIIGDVSKGIINYVSANHPTVGSCGTSPAISAGATNKRATVTEGTIATGCVITFASGGFSAIPNCLVDSASGLQFSYVASATTLTITNIGALSGTSIVYDCAGETVTP